MNKKDKQPQITTMDKLRDAMMGEIVELPGWTDGEPFVARLRRASLTGMIKAGQIPNPLINAAQQLYEGAGSKAHPTFDETAKVILEVVGAALVEPKMSQIEEAGLQLTEQQIEQIYLYAMRGAKALEPFRNVKADPQPNTPGEPVSDAAE